MKTYKKKVPEYAIAPKIENIPDKTQTIIASPTDSVSWMTPYE
jgi:hypothetical protein